MKNMARSIRRHHIERIKSNRKMYWGRGGKLIPRQIGILAHTAAVCSCWMCCNPRKYKEVTIHEKSFLELTRSITNVNIR